MQGLSEIIKILICCLFSMLIGLEREHSGKSAGLRTTMLVALGACLFGLIVISLYGSNSIDISRLFYAPIVGIGFLGGGIIMYNKGTAEGVTTSATLWATVAISLLVSLGKIFLAGFSTLIIYFILSLKYFEKKQ